MQFHNAKWKINQQRIAWLAKEMRKDEGEKPFSTLHARGSLDFILETASRSITLPPPPQKKTL
jgi:hypothetical protein